MDRVVLVPDEATYLDEISRWSLNAQWPVLIEDERWAPLFVRGFKPAQVLRRTDRAPALPGGVPARRAAIEAAITRVWSGEQRKESPAAAYASVGLVPAGLVVTSTEDSAWMAAVALAAGRGQLIAYIDSNLGQPSDTMNSSQFERFNNAITDLFRATKYKFATMGDQLDTCTICRTMAVKCTPNLPANLRFNAPGAPPTNPDDPVAMTDALCRNTNGARYAICGVIWGDAARSAYTAMCSLFLQRSDFTFVSAYGETGKLSPFAVASIQERLDPAGYKMRVMIGSSAKLRAWQLWGMGGIATDALFVNSSGDNLTFHLGVPGETPVEDQGVVVDIPRLARPLALHMVHSFSFMTPGDSESLGHRWLDQGVYAYVGSVWEPFMSAFVPPRAVMERLASMVPFLVAARHWDGPFAVPWRVSTYGDPLMLAPPPAEPIRTRLAPDTVEPSSAGGAGRTLASLRDSAKQLLRECQSNPTPENFHRAFAELEKLGDDTIAVGLWAIAVQKGARDGAARPALGALFRAKDFESYIDALRAVPDPDDAAVDMLWSLATPRLQSLDSVEIVDLLANHPRRVRIDIDLARLAPAMARLRSRDAARAMLLRGASTTTNAGMQQALRTAASEY